MVFASLCLYARLPILMTHETVKILLKLGMKIITPVLLHISKLTLPI